MLTDNTCGKDSSFNGVTVIQNALPIVSISGPTTACIGTTITLTGAGGGTSQWYQNGVAIPSATTNALGVSTSGVYNMIKTNTNGCKDSAAIGKVVVIKPLPVITVNNGTICAGLSHTFLPNGAVSYSYTGGSAIVAPVVTTVYTISGTSSVNCVGSSTASVLVNAAPTITVTNNSPICTGQTATLSVSGANSYSWNNGVNGATNVVFPTLTTVYTATGTVANGCSGTNSQTLIVNPLPNVSLSSASPSICINSGTVALIGSPVGGIFTGSNVSNGVFTPGASGGTFIPMYSYTNATTGCSSSSSTTVIVDLCTTIKTKTALSGLNAYPNPTNGIFTIELPNGLNKTFEVIDLTGKKVLSLSSDKNSVNINLSNLANGVYYLKVISHNQNQVLKVVKQ